MLFSVCLIFLCLWGCGSDDPPLTPRPDAGEPTSLPPSDMTSPDDAATAFDAHTPDLEPSAELDAEADASDMLASDASGVEDMMSDGGFSSAGCRAGQRLTEGAHQFELGGLTRRVMVRLPKTYTTERPWPLVIALHPNGGRIKYWDEPKGGRDLRKKLEEEAILVIPEAIDRQWRDYDLKPSQWPDRLEQELEYLDRVMAMAKEGLCVETRAIFAMGFSGGGSFAGVLGCRREEIRAIATGGAVIYFDKNSCVHQPAAWITLGKGEINGGRESFRDFFRKGASCDASTLPAPPEGCVAYQGCAPGVPVHYCVHQGAHHWPGFGVDASWDFFSALLPP